MITPTEEIIALISQREKLYEQISKKDKRISELERELKEMKERAINAEQVVKPLRDTINALSAERSKWLKQIKKEKHETKIS